MDQKQNEAQDKSLPKQAKSSKAKDTSSQNKDANVALQAVQSNANKANADRFDSKMDAKARKLKDNRLALDAQTMGIATYKNAPTSIKKMRHVANVVRSLNLSHARAQLMHIRQKAAFYIKKCLDAAISNAANLGSIDQNSMSKLMVMVDIGKGRTLRRLLYRAKGRADRIQRKYSNITVRLVAK